MADVSVESINVHSALQDDGTQMYESVVLLQRNGGYNGPVPVVLKFKDGTIVPKSWDPTEAQVEYKVVHSSPLEWVAVDPQHTNVLDNKHINDYMKADLSEVTRTRWSLGTSNVIQGLLGLLGW